QTRILTTVAALCLLTMIGYGGLVVWAMARQTAPPTVVNKQPEVKAPLAPVVAAQQMPGQVRALEGHQGAVECVALTPDGKLVVSASEDKTLRSWDVVKGEGVRYFIGHSAPVHGVAVSPDGKRVASAGWDKTVRLWDIANGKEVKQFTDHED